jgi:hypothetical protein
MNNGRSLSHAFDLKPVTCKTLSQVLQGGVAAKAMLRPCVWSAQLLPDRAGNGHSETGTFQNAHAARKDLRWLSWRKT